MLRGGIPALALAALVLVPACAAAQSPDGAFACEYVARDAVTIGNGATIAADLAVNEAGGFLLLGRNEIAASDVTVTADRVVVGNGSAIPTLAANELHAPRAAIGTVVAPVLPLHAPFCVIASGECGGASVDVERAAHVRLAPGTYGDVTVKNGGALILEAGAYRVCSLVTGRHARIDVTGPGQTTLAVAGELRLGNDSALAPSGGAFAPVVEVGGSFAKLGAGAVVEAFLSAPQALVQIGRGGTVAGAVCAARMGTGRNVTLRCSAASPPSSTSSTTSPSTTTTSTLASSTTTSTLPTTSTTSSSTTTTAPPTTSTTIASSSTTTTSLGRTTTTSLPVVTTSTSGTSTSTTTTTTAIATTTSSTTTSTTTSTTSTTMATGVLCSANGLDVTASIDYPEQLLGGLSAIVVSVSYPPPLDIPGSGNVSTVRARVTNLAGSQVTLSPNDRDTNADGVDDRLDVTARASTTGSVQPGQVFRARYDCPLGSSVAPTSIGCAQSGSIAPDGIPFPPELASQITCSLAVSAAP